jgi:hypothetical protein
MIRPNASIRVLTATALASTLLASGAKAAPDTSGAAFTLHLDSQPAPLIAGKRIATLADAVDTFGRPIRISPLPSDGHACRAAWPARWLAIGFSTTQPGECPAHALGSWTEVVATGPRWHTVTGLSVGDPARRLHTLYPRARRLDFLGQGPIWELETGGPYCDGGPPLSLGARVFANRVGALVILHVPACG